MFDYFFSAGGVVPAGASGAVVLAAGGDVAGGAAWFAGGANVVAGVFVAAAGAVVPVAGAVEPAGGVVGLSGDVLLGSAGSVVGSVVGVVVPDLPRTSPWCFDQKSAIRQKKIQIEAVTIVIRVKMSPAFAPNALEPPMPPRAPAKPPPRPRCTSTSRIRKIARNDNRRASSALMVL